MQINVTFRHVDPTPALRGHAEEKLERMVKKYLHRPVDAHVILSVSKERHTAEITLQADHVTMFAKEETTDLYAAIDLAVEKLEHQAQKLRAKRKEIERVVPEHRAGGPELISLALPVEQAQDVEILGRGPEAAARVVEVLREIGVL